MIGKILSAAIVLLVFIGLYVAVSYMYQKRHEGGGCSRDCSHCGMDTGCEKNVKDNNGKK